MSSASGRSGNARDHFLAGLDVKLVVGIAHPVLVGDEAVGLDAQKRVVRGGVGLVYIVRVVRGDNAQVELARKLHEPRNDFFLGRHEVVLHLYEIVVAPENVHEFAGGLARLFVIGIQQILRRHAVQAAAKAYDALGIFRKGFEVYARAPVKAARVRFAGELGKVQKALVVFRKQRLVVYLVLREIVGLEHAGVALDAVYVVALFAVAPRTLLHAMVVYKVSLYTDDGLYPVLLGVIVKVYGPAHVAVVGHGDRGHFELGGARHEFVHARAPVQKAVVGVDVQVYEV